MATLPSPTPAWWAGGVLSTVPPARKVAKGYIVTRPAGADVPGTHGVPTDDLVPTGTFIAVDITTGRLYLRLAGPARRTGLTAGYRGGYAAGYMTNYGPPGVWQPVAGDPEGAAGPVPPVSGLSWNQLTGTWNSLAGTWGAQ